jgi:hypothetical protein
MWFAFNHESKLHISNQTLILDVKNWCKRYILLFVASWKPEASACPVAGGFTFRTISRLTNQVSMCIYASLFKPIDSTCCNECSLLKICIMWFAFNHESKLHISNQTLIFDTVVVV